MSVMRPKTAPNRPTTMTLCDVIRCGYYQRIDLLVEMGIDVDQVDSEGKSPLILCAFVEPESWGVGITRILIENGAKVSTQDRFGLNVFHYACIYGRFQLSKILLNAIDFDINQLDRYGNTALHYAVRTGNSMITKLIVQCLKRYNLTLNTPNRRGQTALQVAYKLNRYSCVKLLEDDDTFEIPCEDTNLVLGFENSNGKRKCYRECCRSAPVFRRNLNRIKYTQSIRANQKDSERLIRSASAKDFRNTKENIFKLTALSADDSEPSKVSPPPNRPKTAFASRRDSDHSDTPARSWRNELRNLYLNYEFQCTPSWRRPNKPQEIKIEVLSADDDEVDKFKDKKGRRPSCTSRLGLNLDVHNQRRRSSSSPRNARKGSTPNADKRSPSGDTMSTSSDSAVSLTPRTKKEFLVKTELSPKSPKLLDVDSVFN